MSAFELPFGTIEAAGTAGGGRLHVAGARHRQGRRVQPVVTHPVEIA